MSNDGRKGYPDSFHEQVALGLVPGFSTMRKFGDNEAVPSGGVTTDVWPHTAAGVNRRVLPTSAGAVSVASSSVEDDPDKGGAVPGTGTWTIVIEGLDANFLEISETINLNGTAAVTTTQQFLRINRMYGVVEALEGQTHQALYTVPAGKTFLVSDFEITVGRMASSADLHAFGEVKIFGHDTWRIIENIYMATGQNFDTHRPVVPFPEKTEMRVSVHSDAVTQMSAMFGGYLVDNKILETM
jgi:hypothetical protein